MRFKFAGTQSKYSVMSGGVANIGLKLFDRHKISFKNTLTRTADDEVIAMEGPDNDAGFYQRQNALRYVSREVFTTQLIGEHSLPVLSGIDFDWRAFRSLSHRNEPDYRRIYYARDIGSPDDPYFAVLGPQVNLKNGGRYYSDLNDDVRGGSFDIGTPILGVKIKTGALYEEKRRDFSSRLIGMLMNAPGNGFTDFALLYLPLDSIFAPENFRRNGFSIDEYQNGTNNYSAGQTVRAAYAMVDHLIVPWNLRLILGARLEKSNQQIRTRDLTNTHPIDVDKDYTDVLPSANLVYSPWTDANFRVAYSQTINRPELRELAPFSYYDFSTQFSLTGNPYLSRALIRNYDFRVELFPGIGEVVSGSVFYKAMTDAIEQVVKPSASLGSERTYVNSEKAKTYGFELEGRKSLSFIGRVLREFRPQPELLVDPFGGQFRSGGAGHRNEDASAAGPVRFRRERGAHVHRAGPRDLVRRLLQQVRGQDFGGFDDAGTGRRRTGQERRRLRARPEHRPDGRHQALGEGRPPRVAGVHAGRQGGEERLQGHRHRPRDERQVLSRRGPRFRNFVTGRLSAE